jgi:cellulose synthase/poly-beta-1,6-N-acetylglucosamine synthase-like glycosyltransferase
MTTAQSIYMVAFSVYLVFFVLFARFFVWKSYSDKKYWNRRLTLKQSDLKETARALGRDVPFMSVMVPARNESLVIENTVRHLTRLDYPADRFEVVVVTDEKEILAAEADRARIASAAVSVLRGQPREPLSKEQEACVRAVLLSILSEYALREYLSKGFQKKYSVSVPELASLPAQERHKMIRDICIAIAGSHGAPPRKKLFSIVSRTCGWLSPLDQGRVYPACLAVAVPVIAALAEISDGTSRRTLDKTIRHTVQANHELTRDIVTRMTGFIATRVAEAVRKAAWGDLPDMVARTVTEMYPTTQEALQKAMREISSRGDVATVKHVVVPVDFDGRLGGVRTGQVVPSTKGRALNWGIAFLDPRTEVCGFYDAESRPAKDVLLYVGYRRMLDPVGSRVLQGPVFQVRNFYQMTPFCRIASLYQAIAHDWYLPWLFRTLPFVGGTNVFVSKDLLHEVGGWDCTVLTEDLEFGARAYLACDAWPEYLPYMSSEQTPPTFRAFFRQRLRWGTGHLQVVDKVASWEDTEPGKRDRLRMSLLVKGQVEWVAYQVATFVPPVAMGLHYKGLLDPSIVPPPGQWVLSMFSVIYLGFTVYAFKRYSKYLDESGKPDSLAGQLLVYLGLLMLPLAAFVFPVPYTSAMLLRSIGKEPKAWVKTPRTEETDVAG